jgi:hypothetical protein
MPGIRSLRLRSIDRRSFLPFALLSAAQYTFIETKRLVMSQLGA